MDNLPTSKNRKQAPKKPSRREPLSASDLVGLPERIREQFGWPGPLHDFQWDAIESQLKRRDVLVHAGTGFGKTAIAAGPLVHPKTKGWVTIMVSPLLALQQEQVETFEREFKLKALAVNSINGGLTAEVLKKILSREYRVILVSPEMLLARRFVREVLRNQEFASHVFSVVVDEAHVVSHWGAMFRKQYGRLGMIRPFLPSASWVALSATLPARVREDVLKKLQFSRNHYTRIDIGNDRPNVSLVVRSIEHPMNSFADLDFVIPSGMQKPEDIPKTFVYADNVSISPDIKDHLDALLPERLRNAGHIRPFSAAFSSEYRKDVMKLFKAGKVRILICTDAAGMGCNIPDIDVVVQWKLPDKLSTFVQRAGRAARQKDRVGLAVLLVEPAAYAIDIEGLRESKDEGTKKQAHRTKGSKKAKRPSHGKAEAIICGLKRGGCSKTHDQILVKRQLEVDGNDDDEGLLVFVQTTGCRRHVLTLVYGNKKPTPSAPCCDLCDLALLDRTRPGKRPAASRQPKVKSGIPHEPARTPLEEFRLMVVKRDFPMSLFSGDAILKDETIDFLISMGPIASIRELEQLIGSQWLWFEKYGEELFVVLQGLSLPPMQVKPAKPRGTKRRVDEGERVGEQPAAKASKPTKPKAAKNAPANVPLASPEIATTQTATSSQPVLPFNPYRHLVQMPASATPFVYIPRPNYSMVGGFFPQTSASSSISKPNEGVLKE